MPTQPNPIGNINHAEIVSVLVEKLETYYVFPEIGAQIGVRLRDHLQAGMYASASEGESFARLLTEHIQSVNHDKHLRVWWYPEARAEFQAALDQSADWLSEYRQSVRLDNSGFRKVERLDGNVGYLDVRVFHAAAVGGATAVAVMRFLSGVNALIIDLRNCRGGEPNMVALVCSYFFGDEPVQLSSIYTRADNRTQQFWTAAHVEGTRLETIPLYLLTGPITFSGAEAFAYDLQALKRATLIGETTRGGAHPGMTYRLNPHFDVFIPNGRPINPITGANWEGTGVIPDVAVPQDQAFETAYRMAVASVLELCKTKHDKPFQNLAHEAQSALDNLKTSSAVQ